MPEVTLVDMRREWKECGRSLVSRRLEESIAARLERREQVLILLNRRGFAAVLLCRVCGERVECPHCAVSLTVHRSDRTLRCHYCDHRAPVPSVCVGCGASVLQDIGHGTERLQAALRQRFPGARIDRFDADQTQRRGAHARILSSFGMGDIDVLVGTQMLAKGHDFPGVTLVGVVGADSALSMPDFRAAERTFQLLTQMAGRAGRGEVAGEVILQAHQPDHYAIEAAMRHDFVAFYDREIEYRLRLRYPPFVALAACVCRGKLASSVREEADYLAAALRAEAGEGIEVLGPASPPISRLRGRYRVQLLLKAATRGDLSEHLRRSIRRLKRQSRLPRDLVIDIDPQNLL
jgi:primosomal protein N' (replication factor Y)